jgi:hypothetical protein
VFVDAISPLKPLSTVGGGDNPPPQAAKIAAMTHGAAALISRSIVIFHCCIEKHCYPND